MGILFTGINVFNMMLGRCADGFVWLGQKFNLIRITFFTIDETIEDIAPVAVFLLSLPYAVKHKFKFFLNPGVEIIL